MASLDGGLPTADRRILPLQLTVTCLRLSRGVDGGHQLWFDGEGWSPPDLLTLDTLYTLWNRSGHSTGDNDDEPGQVTDREHKVFFIWHLVILNDRRKDASCKIITRNTSWKYRDHNFWLKAKIIKQARRFTHLCRVATDVGKYHIEIRKNTWRKKYRKTTLEMKSTEVLYNIGSTSYGCWTISLQIKSWRSNVPSTDWATKTLTDQTKLKSAVKWNFL